MAGLTTADPGSGAPDYRGWLPIRIWPVDGAWTVDWCRFGARPLREPFFVDSVAAALREPFNQAFRRRSGIDALLDWQARSPGMAPTAFVFHASRCGSTLLTQTLAGLDSHTVLSEPTPLDAVLRAPYRDPSVLPAQPAWTRALLSALGQRRRGTERALVVKLDAWNLFELPLLRRCFPGTPCLFLYRDPLEIAVSQLQSPGRHMVPCLLGPSPLALPDEQALAMERPEFVARTLGRLLEAGLDACARYGTLAVNYDELPDAIGGRLAPLLGLDDGQAARARTGMTHHAKRPGDLFQPDRSRKRQAADDGTRRQVAQWTDAAYAALEALRLATD
ncbi:aspartyl beta-hydroxylase [Frateuria sp. Soil773]|uniref:aspartyl beta-hydroxylase n=1 Tax=Frateuria sp. Soil773 TaxID=1736407 RepID=UPI0006F74433|nr:aspartyl beta-hydroxylase [Frateuria sp. Soil773]KRF02077.1 aspartyl beta-hydroxylase [Frateuria sp. Soil773]